MASMKPSSSDSWDEPTLDELFADPIIQLIMQRDGVNVIAMRGEMDRVRLSFSQTRVA